MRRLLLGAVLLAIAALVAPGSSSAHARVLRVGKYHGIRGKFKTIQAAVDKAQPGDWVLVGSGDYHERADRVQKGDVPPAGVLITKARIHLRGMNRNGVTVDGTKPGSSRCSRKPGAQDFGVKENGTPVGRNGVVAFKVSGVSIENLTVCNFLAGDHENGNEIWWNGGDGSGLIGMGKFRGTHLNATSTFYNGDEAISAKYGIFASNAKGPGVWSQTYASNFNDSGYYEGACRQECNLTMRKAWSQYSALGYSGTNSGGKIVVKESEFDHNQDGFDTNSQNNDDAPSPQDGSCPNGGTSHLTHSVSCWVFMDNYVHDNNNPNVPGAGVAGSAPVGTGISISGGRFDTVMGNRIVHNGAWGVLLVPFPDTDTPPPVAHCEGGVETGALGFGCLYDDWGNQVFENQFSQNGFFGNPTNGDIGQITFFGGNPVNCLRRNKLPDGVSPESLLSNTCGTLGSGDINQPLLEQVECNTQILGPAACPPGSEYPRKTQVKMHGLPKAKKLPTMGNPCKEVPNNPWCPAKKG